MFGFALWAGGMPSGWPGETRVFFTPDMPLGDRHYEVFGEPASGMRWRPVRLLPSGEYGALVAPQRCHILRAPKCLIRRLVGVSSRPM